MNATKVIQQINTNKHQTLNNGKDEFLKEYFCNNKDKRQ